MNLMGGEMKKRGEGEGKMQKFRIKLYRKQYG